MSIPTENHAKSSRDLVVETTHPGELLAVLKKGAVLSVWKRALNSRVLAASMMEKDWPLQMLELKPATKAWHLNRGEDVAPGTDQDAKAALQAACSIPPDGNAHVALSIRNYCDDNGRDGALEWWRNLSEPAPNAMVQAFVAAVVNMLQSAERERLRLLIEEISVVVSRDPTASLSTLTPTLHADEHYGPCVAALVSVCADPKARNSTTFVPTITMETVWHLRPIELKDLPVIVRTEDLYRASSGDLVLYSGMKDKRGIVSRSNGVPHISSDIPGNGTRLVVLLRRAGRELP